MNATSDQNVVCPLCGGIMHSRTSVHPDLRQFVCERCHADLRTPMSREPDQVERPHETAKATACQACKTSALHCFECGDSVCEQHVETVEKYASYLSGNLKSVAVQEYGHKVFCPACFRAVMNRMTHKIARVGLRSRPSLVRWPITLLLVAGVLIISLGVRSCPASENPPLPGVEFESTP